MENKVNRELLDYVSVSLESISKAYAAYYKKFYELTPNQMSTLWYLLKGGTMTMTEFVAKLYMSKQQGTQHIEQLVQKGLVEREYRKENRRTIYIKITDNGKAIINDINEKYTTTFLEELSKIDSEDQKLLLEAIKVINKIGPQLELRPK